MKNNVNRLSMSTHPLHLLLRFFLELASLVISSIWTWKQMNENYRVYFALLVPVFMATVWTVFTVPGDPSRSEKVIVPISGASRFVLECSFFGFAGLCFFLLSHPFFGMAFLITVFFQYLLSYDRVNWLLKR